MSIEIPPCGTPRPIEDALRWQCDRVGSRAWEDWGLKFQRMAYGYAVEAGVADTREALNWLTSHDTVDNGEPPPWGKLVWYSSHGRVSVMSSLNDGQVVGTGVDGAVGVIHYRQREGYLGWSEPLFPYAS